MKMLDPIAHTELMFGLSSNPQLAQQVRAMSEPHGGSKSSDALMLEVQTATQRYKRSYELLSNIMKGLHDTQMTAVNNMR